MAGVKALCHLALAADTEDPMAIEHRCQLLKALDRLGFVVKDLEHRI